MTKELPPLHPNDSVWICHKGKWEPAVVIDLNETPGQDRIMFELRIVAHLDEIGDIFFKLQSLKTTNRQQLQKQRWPTWKDRLRKSRMKVHEGLTTDQVTTRSGRVVKKPKRFGDYEL